MKQSLNVLTAALVGLGLMLLGPAAFAATPDPTVLVSTSADQLSNGLLAQSVAVLPYIIPVMVAFTIFGRVRGWLGAKKK